MKVIDKSAFTLAEVLITLAIIGVVAAMTIPSIIANTQKTEYASKLKKEYSALTNAFNLLAQEYGGSITDVPGFSSTTDDSTEDISALSAFATKLSIQKNCGSNTGCWYSSQDKYLGGGVEVSNLESTWKNKYAKTILTDGTLLVLNIYSESCMNNPHNSSIGQLENSVCGEIVIDINGNSNPNQRGRDIHSFWIAKKGIFPRGSYNDGCSCLINSSSWATSDGCTAKVLTEGAMNY